MPEKSDLCYLEKPRPKEMLRNTKKAPSISSITQPALGTPEKLDTVCRIQTSRLPPDVSGADDGEVVREIRSL